MSATPVPIDSMNPSAPIADEFEAASIAAFAPSTVPPAVATYYKGSISNSWWTMIEQNDDFKINVTVDHDKNEIECIDITASGDTALLSYLEFCSKMSMTGAPIKAFSVKGFPGKKYIDDINSFNYLIHGIINFMPFLRKISIFIGKNVISAH